MTKQTTARYSPEVRARAVRMVFEHQSDYPSQWAAMNSIASKIGCTGETLRKWVRQRRTTMRRSMSSLWWRDSNQTASGNPGAVH